ncbi:PD-(D/E)XK nuclease superfamily protein [Natranaerovirga hydrolytica]|uniref:PD-(D/E)XK nuclease superfamily protein n=1 Tax=Natranaerovirga hydrolytica TaxID=680378 RepID=A0A4R1MXX2_9FIRM|nr:PD-(D/E)XK nuclease family protein [Natranaerovirga hydrolytica]TCK98056.1 PD-(D/E)XK nuclease superfamily protein [Natranaerovirga hydrolytica]
MEHLLNKFIINNVKLDRLESKLNKFNPLKVLKIDEYEIRHSNMLAWLLDPNENHGLGEEFLKKFLGEVILLNEDVDLDISILDIYLNNFYDIQISREWKNIDILVTSHDNKVVLLIENKVRAKESKGQLRQYSDLVDSKFNEYRKLKIYLTIDGEEPSENGYVICDYYSILKILTHIMELNAGNLNNKVEDFINYYIDVLKNIVEEDKETLLLCKEIYSENEEIIDYIAYNKTGLYKDEGGLQEKILNVYNIYEKSIDMILSLGKTNPFLEAANQFVEENNDIILEKGVNSYCCFINKDMKKIQSLSNVGTPIYYIFDNKLKNNRLRMFIEVQTFGENYKQRQEFLRKLNEIDRFTISEKSFNPESRYTRVYSISIILRTITEQNILNAMNKIYRDSITVLDEILLVATSVLENGKYR